MLLRTVDSRASALLQFFVERRLGPAWFPLVARRLVPRRLQRSAGDKPPRYKRWRAAYRRTVQASARAARGALTLLIELLLLLFLVGLTGLFYWRLLTTNPLDAATITAGDFTDLNYPYQHFVAGQVARGEAPWWNPYVSAGHSAIGDIQFQTLYPPSHLLDHLAGPSFPFQGLEILVVAHVALAVVGTYLLARRLTRSRIGGLVAAITFGFGGYLAGYPIQQINILETSAWLPLILLGIELGMSWTSFWPFVGAAGAFGLAALASHPQSLLYVCIASGVYLAYRSFQGGRFRPIGLLGAIVLFGGGLALAAGALLPAAVHLSLTNRDQVDYAYTTPGFALHELLGAILPLPGLTGGTPLYVGILPLVLAVLALATPARRGEKIFWASLAIVSLLFSFGGNTFLQVLLYLALPFLKFREHERLTFLYTFAVALLAGFGASTLSQRWNPVLRERLTDLGQGLRWPILILAGAALAFLYGVLTLSGAPRNASFAVLDRLVFTTLVVGLVAALFFVRARGGLTTFLTASATVLIVLFDLFSTNWQTNLQPGAPNAALAPTPIVSYLQSATFGPVRIASEGLLPGDGNAGALDRLQDVVGNTPLETKRYADFTAKVPEWTRWQLLNVGYIITKRKLGDQRLSLVLKEGDVNLYQLHPNDRLPRAYVVHQTITARTPAEALTLDGQIDPRQTAVVEGAPVIVDGSASSHDEAVMTMWSANALTINAHLATPGLLVVSEVDYPGWQATVDGRPAPIILADGLLRSLRLGTGSHVIHFRYVPVGLATGQRIAHEALRDLEFILAVELALRVIGALAALVGWAYRRLRHPHESARYSC